MSIKLDLSYKGNVTPLIINVSDSVGKLSQDVANLLNLDLTSVKLVGLTSGKFPDKQVIISTLPKITTIIGTQKLSDISPSVILNEHKALKVMVMGSSRSEMEVFQNEDAILASILRKQQEEEQAYLLAEQEARRQRLEEDARMRAASEARRVEREAVWAREREERAEMQRREEEHRVQRQAHEWGDYGGVRVDGDVLTARLRVLIGDDDGVSTNTCRMPPSVLERAVDGQLQFPLLFQIPDSKVEVVLTVSEFTAEEGTIVLSPIVLSRLSTQYNSLLNLTTTSVPTVTSISLLPLLPHAWNMISHEEQVGLMEFYLRKVRVLSEGSILYLPHLNTHIPLFVTQCQPAKTVSLVDSHAATEVLKWGEDAKVGWAAYFNEDVGTILHREERVGGLNCDWRESEDVDVEGGANGDEMKVKVVFETASFTTLVTPTNPSTLQNTLTSPSSSSSLTSPSSAATSLSSPSSLSSESDVMSQDDYTSLPTPTPPHTTHDAIAFTPYSKYKYYTVRIPKSSSRSPSVDHMKAVITVQSKQASHNTTSSSSSSSVDVFVSQNSLPSPLSHQTYIISGETTSTTIPLSFPVRGNAIMDDSEHSAEDDTCLLCMCVCLYGESDVNGEIHICIDANSTPSTTSSSSNTTASTTGGGVEGSKCPTCQQFVPTSAMSMHSLRCARQVKYCQECNITYHPSHHSKHIAVRHTPLLCPCGASITIGQVSSHCLYACEQRSEPCRYCSMIILHKEASNHSRECGVRNAQCSICHESHMRRRMRYHISSEHGLNLEDIDHHMWY